MQLGNKIKKIRDLKGLKQEDIAEKLNITAQAYGKIERNETKLDVARLAQIAEILGMTPDDVQNFDDKNMFINNLQECQNSQGTYFIVNNYSSDNEHLISAFERIIEQQKQEILFLREQLSKTLDK
jgi:transcriptional regulator with XRE-family HTH domain